METKKNYIVIISVLICLIYFIYKIDKDNKELSLNSRYTIGIVNSVYPIIGGFNIKYTYEVNTIEYEGINRTNKISLNKIGDIFIVQFSPNDPNNSKILLNHQISDSLVKAPKNGWVEIPKDLTPRSR